MEEIEIPHFSVASSIELKMPVRQEDGSTAMQVVQLYPISSLALFRLAHLSGPLAKVVDALTTKAPADVRQSAIAELVESALGNPQKLALLVLDAMQEPERKRIPSSRETDAFVARTPGIAMAVLLMGVVRVNLEAFAPFAAGLPREAAEALAEAGEQVMQAAGSGS